MNNGQARLSNALKVALPAVNVDSLAVDETGGVGTQERAQGGDVVGVPQAVPPESPPTGAGVLVTICPSRLVSIMPGTMQLTRIPLGPSSVAKARVSPISPTLAAEMWAPPWRP